MAIQKLVITVFQLATFGIVMGLAAIVAVNYVFSPVFHALVGGQ
jgi:hypothetical protein